MKPKPQRMELRVDNIPVELTQQDQWVVWLWKYVNGQWTKPPYSPRTGGLASTTDPETWVSFPKALKAFERDGFDGIGFVITKEDDFTGIDWDDCRDIANGECDPEVWEWIKQVDSYTEVSPSGKGYKSLIKGKLPAGGHHKAKVGVFDKGRYFCITGNLVNGASPGIEQRQDELTELIQAYWPQDLEPKQVPPPPRVSNGHSLSDQEIIDKALSAKDGGKFKQLWEGDTSGYVSPSEADLALCNKLVFYCGPDPARINHLFQKSGLYRDKWNREDYSTRTILKALAEITEYYTPPQNIPPEDPEEIEDYVARLNDKHALVMLGGKTVVMNEVTDPVFGRPDVTFSTITDYRNWYANQQIFDGKNMVSVATLWLKSPDRRQYEGIIFEPAGGVNGYYNLWRGFSVEPVPGDWSILKAHIFENICQENVAHYDYLLAWMAHTVQYPGGSRAGTSVVLRGDPGVGKGVFCTQFGSLFGSHFLHITNQNQLTGRFNSHLKDALVVFCDEAIWAGDKPGEGVLKGMITEDYIMVEPKGKDAFPVKNRIRLIVASNSSWVVPAGLQDRRFFALDVSDSRRRDNFFFGELIKQMNTGGREAMLHELLGHDTSTIDLRINPDTTALTDQKLHSMTTAQKFWHDCLQNGSIGDTGWPITIATRALYDHYLEFAKKINERYPGTDATFGKELKNLVPLDFKRNRPIVGDERQYIYSIPDLEVCRHYFQSKLESDLLWE